MNLEMKSLNSAKDLLERSDNGTPEWTIDNLTWLWTEWLASGTCPLSPYPKEYREKMEWRAQMLRRADKDLDYRAKVKELFHRDPLFAFNAFFYTLDVRRKPRHHRPFATYFYQDIAILNLVDAIRNKQDLPWEKSRDMGASWIFIGVYTWFWLDPKGGADFLLGSRVEKYVDEKGNMRTLFEKIRYLLYRLPWWLMPKGFNKNKHDNYMKIVNPETQSSLTGESNNANFGTGGRYSGVLLDEFPKWEGTDEAAWTSLGDATPSRHPIGTPFGAGGKHYELVTDGITRKLVLHWSLHPLKGAGLACHWPKHEKAGKIVDFLHWKGLTSPWYEAEVARRKKRKEIAQELDIDYIGAGQVVFESEELDRVLELMRIEKKPLLFYRPLVEAQRLEEVNQELVDDLDGLVVVYELPTERSLEVLGIDVAEGKEDGDFAVIKIMNRYTKSLIVSFYSQINEVVLAYVAKAIIEWIQSFKTDYKQWPWTVVETIGPGLATFDLLASWDVSNLFMMPVYDKAKNSISYTKGLRTNAASRNKGIALWREWLRDCQGWVDHRCCREATTFVRNKTGKPEAKPGCHDDEVMAWMLCLLGDIHLPAIDFQELDNLSLLEKIRVIQQQAAPKQEEPSIAALCFKQAQKRQQAIGVEL